MELCYHNILRHVSLVCDSFNARQCMHLRTICGKMSLKMMIISNKKYFYSLLTLMHLLFQMIKNIDFLADHQIVLTVGSQSPFSWNVL